MFHPWMSYAYVIWKRGQNKGKRYVCLRETEGCAESREEAKLNLTFSLALKVWEWRTGG